jgi:hypothetical protein
MQFATYAVALYALGDGRKQPVRRAVNVSQCRRPRAGCGLKRPPPQRSSWARSVAIAALRADAAEKKSRTIASHDYPFAETLPGGCLDGNARYSAI